MSEETSGSFETDNTSLYLSVCDSSISTLLISSTEVFFAARKVMSEIEPTVTVYELQFRRIFHQILEVL
jgi:hypothetical protein